MPDIPVGAEQIAFFLETGTVAGQYKGSAVFLALPLIYAEIVLEL